MAIETPVNPQAAEVGVADLNIYLQDPHSEAALAECRKVAESLIVCSSIPQLSRSTAYVLTKFLEM